MTNKDIFNYITFRTKLEQLLNDYVSEGLPATILKPVLDEALTAIINASAEEIENAKAEIAAEKLCEESKENANTDDEESVGLTD